MAPCTPQTDYQRPRRGIVYFVVWALCATGHAQSKQHTWTAVTPWARGKAPQSSSLRIMLRLGGGARAGLFSSSATQEKIASSDTAAREKMYEAYNLLHTLGKEFQINIQAPSVLVVGHQSGGKSALIEALMGFQFNNVGGGTKTRRPIALHMRYNPACSQPVCFLTNDVTGREQRMTLEEIQEYITSENQRLAESDRHFDHREISVRIEYRHCPNMVVVDTPGLISAAHQDQSSELRRARMLNKEEIKSGAMAREAENLVLTKMKQPEYIILCVEDTMDWKHANTRRLVEQADPTFQRTVLVNTKLDTKLVQFSDPSDVEDFIGADAVHSAHPALGGGPFFTSVPAGRVGKGQGFAFKDNEAFIQGLRRRERQDVAAVESKVGPVVAAALSESMGVAHLRRFLEERVEKSYRANVATIVPVLQAALKKTEDAQLRARADLDALSTDSLRTAANQYREHFAKAVNDCIQGTIAAPPSYFGETLEEERQQGGSFCNLKVMLPNGESLALSGTQDEAAWSRIVQKEVGHSKAKLFGGSQYHRALREFALAVQHMTNPEVTSDEIANAAGVSEVHDGTNYMRAACTIAVAKAQLSFEPLIMALQARARHVMRRLVPIVNFILESRGVSVLEGGRSHESSPSQASAQSAAFRKAVESIFAEFVESALAECLERCEDDLKGMTRFVTWDLHERGALAVQDSLPSREMVNVYALTMKKKSKGAAPEPAKVAPPSKASRKDKIVEEWAEASDDAREGRVVASSLETRVTRNDENDLMTLMEQVACMRDGERTTQVVGALVQHIVRAWRMSFAQNVAMKFNCFFLLPFMEEFPFYLRSRLDKMYDAELKSLFDLSGARASLERRLEELSGEHAANLKLQAKFEAVNRQLAAHTQAASDEAAGDPRPDPRADRNGVDEPGEAFPREPMRQSARAAARLVRPELTRDASPEASPGPEAKDAADAMDDLGEWWAGDDDER